MELETTDSGIEDCSCKKLSGVSKAGRYFKSSAFIVTLEKKYKDIAFNEDTWPTNSLVREWFYNNNNSTYDRRVTAA